MTKPETDPTAQAGVREPVVWVTPETFRDLLNNEPWTAGAIGEFSQRRKDDYTVALYAAQPAQTTEAVGIKPLVWREEVDEDEVWAVVALGLGCRYEAFPWASDADSLGVQCVRLDPTEDGHLKVTILGYGKTLAEAKTLAQADFSSTLAPAPPSTGAEPVAWPVGDAYVTWYEPHEIPKPGKLIDCSLSVIDRAEIGDRFYSERQVRELLAANAVAGMTEIQVVRLLEERFSTSGLSYDAFGATVGLSGEFIRNVLLEQRPPSKAILDIFGLKPIVAYYVPAQAAPAPQEQVSERYTPKIIHFDGEGDPHWEFVERDCLTITDLVFAANVEKLLDADHNLIGFRIYDPASPVAAVSEREAVIEAAMAIIDAKAKEIRAETSFMGYAINRLSEVRDAIRSLARPRTTGGQG